MEISISDFVLIALVVFANLSVALLVISRNPRSLLNRWYFILAVAITVWAATSMASDSTASYEVSKITSWIAYGASFFAVSASYIFSKVFTNGKLIAKDYWTFGLLSLFSLLFATPLVYNLTTFDTYELGPLYYVYMVMVVGLVLLVIRNFRRIFKKGSVLQKSQARALVAAISLTVFFALITNAIIPAIVDTTATTIIGPMFSIVFVSLFAYAIARHHLFDIRLVVARSAAYALLISTLSLLYAITILGAARIFSTHDPGTDDVIPFLAALFVAATAPYFKHYFDRLTNRLFYRDNYNPQAFLDQLNKTVISNIELGVLLRHSAQVIEDNLKCEYVQFGVFAGARRTRYIGVANNRKSIEDVAALKELVAQSRKIIETDTIEADEPKLHAVLAKNDIAVLAKLISSLDVSQEATAYMFLGPKKSGAQYNRQDLQIIEIIADELVVAIQNALRFEEIQNFNVTLQEKVDDATRKLRKTNDKLRELDETKDDFISMASHQLRTPLTSVKGYLSMVLEGDAGKITATQEKMLQQAFVSSQRMTYLISDLLNVSRLKTGKFIIERTSTNLVSMVQQEIAQLTEAAKGRNLTLLFEPPKEFPNLMLDETKTRQLVMNFVDNAIYYTPPGGTIEIKVADRPESVELTVVDNGLGVPRRDQPHLFTKFYRANNARKARPDGTGLGLFMAKKVVIAQGGAIIFRSQEGKGSTFGFTFPKTKELTTVR